ncbi:unnamed protein product, partial [Ectocarpus sp. 13 AM-2016]
MYHVRNDCLSNRPSVQIASSFGLWSSTAYVVPTASIRASNWLSSTHPLAAVSTLSKAASALACSSLRSSSSPLSPSLVPSSSALSGDSVGFTSALLADGIVAVE